MASLYPRPEGRGLTLRNDKNIVWIIQLENSFSSEDLLLSKVSEAINPLQKGNEIGEGGTIDDFINHQPNLLFIINGGFNHYRKDFYNWPHNDFNVGDPVGLIKIREHYYEDYLDLKSYGFFTQFNKKEPWKIETIKTLDKSSKYILGCTPLLIYNNQRIIIKDEMKPVLPGTINPPSFLGHGLQKHPRSAVGIKDNSIFFIVVEGLNQDEGCTLLELQDIGMSLRLNSFLNLDGGGSSQFKIYDNLLRKWISNAISPYDKNRILGNVIALFKSKE